MCLLVYRKLFIGTDSFNVESVKKLIYKISDMEPIKFLLRLSFTNDFK